MTPELAEIIKTGNAKAAQPYIDGVIRTLAADKWLAHQHLFSHRHTEESAPFHRELVADFWSADQYSLRMAFRGSAKSTLAEEDIVIAALYVMFHNILIIGASEARAAERLAAIAYELENNELITETLFGEQKTKRQAWTQTKLVTTRNVCIQAMGRDQDIRGIKYLDYRPDFILVDDFEDKDSVQTPEGRSKTLRWFLAELLPACTPSVKIRVRATPMDVESVPMRLMNEAKWPTKIYPVEHLDESGRRVASWPQRYPMRWIDSQRRNYEALGEMSVWNREYMCEAVSDADRIFQRDMIRVEAREKTFEAVYAMIDPARTIRSSSASTGWAVWSWVTNRLVVWAAGAPMLLPDEIVALAFDIAERFDPIWIGVEKDGLEEFLMQPFRHEQVRRGVTLPLHGERAPRIGQDDFIKGLQPFFAGRQCIFAQPLPDLEAQLLNFPTGRRDAVNALAYALQMRPARPVYEGFTPDHIVEGLIPFPSRLHLAVNATGAVTTAMLVQHQDGVLRILADWVFEGAPGERVADIVAAANLAVDAARWKPAPDRSWKSMLSTASPDRLLLRHEPPLWVVPPHHSDRYTNVGLMQAIRHLPADLRVGGEEHRGALYIREALQKTVRGMPAVEISPNAKWTLRALAGGYTRAMVRGRLQEYAEEGPYRVLMEALESFAALASVTTTAQIDEDNDQNYRVHEATGARYASAMPQRRPR